MQCHPGNLDLHDKCSEILDHLVPRVQGIFIASFCLLASSHTTCDYTCRFTALPYCRIAVLPHCRIASASGKSIAAKFAAANSLSQKCQSYTVISLPHDCCFATANKKPFAALLH